MRTNEDPRTGTIITIKGGATVNAMLVPTPCPLIINIPFVIAPLLELQLKFENT